MNDAVAIAKKAREIFEDVSNFSGDLIQQELRLKEICNGNATLKAAALKLIQSDRDLQEKDFLCWSPLESKPGEDPLVGKCLGDYRLLELIGSGATGIVYRAYRVDETQQEVAIKILRFSYQDSNGRRRFDLEKQALARLSHPSIAKLITSGEAKDGTPYIVMEYIDGERLDHRLKRVSTNSRERIGWFLQLVQIVAYSHEHGILHRDIKPANILVTTDNRLVVTDFGIAKFFDPDSPYSESLTATGGIVGTPGYMAPEQYSGTCDVTTATDVYGLGAVLYFFLTLRPPIGSALSNPASSKARFSNIERPSQLDSSIDKDIEFICLKCLETGAENRYKSVPQLADEVQRYLNGIPIEARTISLTERAIRWSNRNRFQASLLLCLAATFLVSSVLVTYLLVQSEKKNKRLSRQQAQLLDTMQDQFESVSDWIEKHELTNELSAELLAKAELNAREIESMDTDSKDGRKTAAVTYFRTAKLAEKLGHLTSTQKNANKALAIFAQLAKQYPKEHRVRFDIFHCHMILRDHQTAFGIISGLNQEFDDPYYRDAFAASAIECGRLAQNETEKAKYFRLAWNVATPLADEFAENLFFRRHHDRLVFLFMAEDFGPQKVFQHSRVVLPMMENAMRDEPADNPWVNDYTHFCSRTIDAALLVNERDEAIQIARKLIHRLVSRKNQFPGKLGGWVALVRERARLLMENLFDSEADKNACIDAAFHEISQVQKLDSSDHRVTALKSLLLVEFFRDDPKSMQLAEQLVERIPDEFNQGFAAPALIEFGHLDHAERILTGRKTGLPWRFYLPLVYSKKGEHELCEDALSKFEEYEPFHSFQMVKDACSTPKSAQ